MLGATNKEKLSSDEKYSDAARLYKMCNIQAFAYAETMVTRIEQERPEIYEEKEMSKGALVAKLVNNMCLDISKYHS